MDNGCKYNGIHCGFPFYCKYRHFWGFCTFRPDLLKGENYELDYKKLLDEAWRMV